MSQFREAQVYVHRKTLRRLWWIAKIKGMVPDALADEILTNHLEKEYPALLEAEKKVKDAEKEFASAFGKTVEEIKLD